MNEFDIVLFCSNKAKELTIISVLGMAYPFVISTIATKLGCKRYERAISKSYFYSRQETIRFRAINILELLCLVLIFLPNIPPQIVAFVLVFMWWITFPILMLGIRAVFDELKMLISKKILQRVYGEM